MLKIRLMKTWRFIYESGLYMSKENGGLVQYRLTFMYFGPIYIERRSKYERVK